MWLKRGSCILAIVIGSISTTRLKAQSPLIEAQRVAAQDARSLPPGAAQYTRYFALWTLSPKNRIEFLKVLNFHCNQLSREALLKGPRLLGVCTICGVPITDASVVAINTRDYRWETKTYDRLADSDYIFHALVFSSEDVFEEVEKDVPYGYWVDMQGRRVPYGTQGARWITTEIRKEKERVKTKKKTSKQISAQAPWLDPLLSAELISLTQSRAPLLNAQWFINQTAIARKDEIGYYDLLELGKKEADFQKLIAADPKLSREFRREIAGILGRSGVAINNRRVVRFQGLGGGYWITEDFISSKGQKNVLNFMDGDTEPPEGDASEQYGVLPNGLFAYYLINKDKQRQDFVPAETIAADSHTISNDKKIYAGKSCIACHVEGIRPIDDYARRLYRGRIQLQSVDYDKYVRLSQLYLSDLKKQVSRDTLAYSEALVELNGEGWTPTKNAKAYEREWDSWVEEDWNSERVALLLGTDRKTLIAALETRMAPAPRGLGQLEPTLALLIADPEIPLRIEYIEDNYSLLQQILINPKYKP